ncbi:Fibroblast growth factor receptor-like protein 1 [Hypsibius exemplaris]|uniref:Fibroblast growth factor receptor-like protein 1 n=1 Tax=Hypsibius exemplaris TaxID=2072580 RepID=A0A9X6NDI3_HYPEX|nr:Fibroblast growth factor receptor-like protein 1 [Hypsibius exemplaris]
MFKTTHLLASLAGGVLLFCLCLVWAGCRRTTKRKSHYGPCPSNVLESSSNDNAIPNGSIQLTTPSLFYRNTVIPVEENPEYWAAEQDVQRDILVLGDLIDVGQFGEVRHGDLRWKQSDGVIARRKVAVKTLKRGMGNVDELLSELEVMQCLGRHPNVIELINCGIESPPICIVMELTELGNLKNLLVRMQKNIAIDEGGDYLQPRCPAGTKVFSYKDQLDAALQIASGMSHVSAHGILHRDLAARNILVTADYIMKVADFGLSRDTGGRDYYRVQTSRRLPVKWIAPEALQDNYYTTESDVWSYGVLIWEIMTFGQTPYGPSNITPEALLQFFATGQRLEAPPNCPAEMSNLMQCCWNEEPRMRPTFQGISAHLLSLTAQSDEPPSSVEETPQTDKLYI